MSKHRTRGTMRDRLVSGVLCLALVLGLLPAGLVQPAEAAYWADPYGQQLVEWGVMRGDISGNLNLANPITRAEFVTMCNRAFGYTRLGTMPFTDVASTDWYAEDINIAYNAGYFKGTSTTGNLASPNARLTREQAAVLLARNMLLRETSGESLGFSDSRTLNEWSRGLIGAAVAEGMLTGYSDGSFRPSNPITRGEVAAMLVRVIGTPVNKSGNQGLGDVYGNVTISSSNVSLRNTTIAGNLYITGGVDLGNVLLENVTVLGRIVISGGGESDASKDSITLRNVEAEQLVVDSMVDQFVTVLVQGVSDIPLTSVRTNAYLNDSSWPGYGLTRIEQDGAALLQLAGSIKEVVNLTPSSDLQLVQGSAERVTIDELAKNSQMTIIRGTRVDELNLDVATLVTGDEMGKGDIKDLNVGASGSEIDILPDSVEIRPGTTATIEGEKMDSVSGAELSTEPHILAGYPTMVNVAPTEAEVQFGGNKPGTIYWAISSLADGSVSEEDLISNPAYGSNIYEEQAGSRDVSAKTIYSEKVEKLTPDGSYYISAIMVDGRGKRSPLKVAAFTTPDDTMPDFIAKTTEPNTNGKYAYMSKVTTTVAQVTAAANKDCLLYWALLPEGAAAPTAQQFKTGSVGGNYGYGSINMVKNTPISITVNSRRLMEKTQYVLYLWLTDHNGAQSMAAPLSLTVSTPDETPPIVSGVEQVAPFGTNTADVTYAINEAPATLYWAVVAQGNTTFIALTGDAEEDDALLRDLRTKIKVESGASAGAIVGGASSVQEAYTNAKFTISGLDPAKYGNNFTLYYVGKDAAGNYSEKVGSISIQTLDTTPPTVVDPPQFTSYNGDKTNEPLADTGIKLVFSEQVKGGANAGQTFLELYNAAIDPNVTGTAHDDAVDKYVEALSSHIQLYQRPRTGNTVLLNDKINFENVIVTQENDGTVVIFLPGTADRGQTVGGQTITDPAISLDGGATYYFQLLGIFDNAFTPNGVSNTGNNNPSGNLTMKEFTTVYAQINLSENEESNTKSDGTGVRLDMCLNMDPVTTQKVADTERWDMVLWSDTSVEFTVYLRVLEGNTVREDWKCINKDDIPARITVNSNQDFSGISLTGNVIENSNQAVFPALGSLNENYTYQYGIHFTKVGQLSESEYESWSSLVTMRFAIIAGGANGLGTVANNVNANYDKKGDYNVSSIGTAFTSEGTSDILVLRRQFTDRTVPNFTTGSPSFTAGSSTIHMELALDRNGTIFYVVAPATGQDSLITTYGEGADTVRIDDENDGRTGSTYKKGTYIPEDGVDREKFYDMIAYPSIKDPKGNGGYSAPSYLMIVNPGGGDLAKSGNVEFNGRTVAVDVTGLMPSTADKEQWYYIYFVLQGGGEVYSEVQCYRVEMKELETPSITVNGTSSTVSLEPDAETEINYAMWQVNYLPDIFQQTITYTETGTGGTTQSKSITILDAIVTPLRGSGGKTYFDEYATESQKNTVVQYVMGSTTGYESTLAGTWKIPNTGNAVPGSVNHPGYAQPNVPITVPFDERVMTSTTSQYVVIAVARNRYGGYSGADYGFGGVTGLTTPDKIPPEFDMTKAYPMGTTTGPKYLQPALDLPDDISNVNWLSRGFDGTVTITFTKELYYHQNSDSKLYQVWPTTPTEAKDKAIAKGFMEVLGGSAVTNGHVEVKLASGNDGKAVTSSITLNLKGIKNGEDIVFFGAGSIANRSDYSAGKTLTLTFNGLLMSDDYNPGISLGLHQPGFVVNWS